MNHFKIFAIVVLGLFLAGCETIKTVVVTQSVWRTAVVDEIYLEDCLVAAPVERDAYATMSADEREDALTRTVIAQYKYTKSCTLDKRAIRKSLREQNSLIEKRNAEEAQRVLEEKKRLEK